MFPQAFEPLFALVLSRIVLFARNPFGEWRGFIGGCVRLAKYLRRLHDVPFRGFLHYDGQFAAASSKQHSRERDGVVGLHGFRSSVGVELALCIRRLISSP